ncbi:MAG: hypothetical protein K2Y21_11735 [Phycisphaerales bacterium]|nr:hypothetical protein [Phycisphaerales bacterium]
MARIAPIVARVSVVAALVSGVARADEPASAATQANTNEANATKAESAPASGSFFKPKTKNDWTFQFEPSAWYAGLGGKIRIAGAPANVGRVRINDLNLDDPKLTPSGELHLRTGDWRFSFGAFWFNQRETSPAAVGGQLGPIAFAAGDVVTSKYSHDSYEPTVGYEIWRRDPQQGDSVKFLPRIELLAGARIDDVEFSFQRAAVTAKQHETFGQVIAGVKGSMDIADQFSIDLQITGGGWPGGQRAVSWDIMVGFGWRPIENVGLQVGYRNLFSEFKSGSDANKFSYQGATAGLFFGAIVRF